MEQLLPFTEELKQIESAKDAAAMDLRVTYRKRLEGLLRQRSERLAGVTGFWSGVLASPNTPLYPLMDNVIDHKLARAVERLEVTSKDADGKLIRRVSVVLRPNIIAEGGEVAREVDGDGETLTLMAIKWKPGTERAHRDSLFSFFSNEPSGGAAFVARALEAFDETFQDPFLATQEG